VPERAFKYHGLGNDFVILDRRDGGGDIDAERARALCDRRRGVGADGVLVLLPSARGVARMSVHNADGSVAEMCGNGLRCAVKHLVDQGPARPEAIDVETGAGVLTCRVLYGAAGVEEVEVAMGPARLVAPNLPSAGTGRPFVREPLPGHPVLRGTAVSLGNPHLVLFDADAARAGELGPKLERTFGFADRTNVELARVVGDAIEVTVWERGAGLTLACGTGACATVAAAAVEERLAPGRWTRVRVPGGDLHVFASPDLSSVSLRGPATYVFEAVLPSV